MPSWLSVDQEDFVTKKNVVITGWAQTSPLGSDVKTFVDRCYSGTSGFRPISLYETKGSTIRFAGEHNAPDTKLLPDRKFQKVLNRRDQTSVLACVSALQAAGLNKGDVTPDRIGLFVGVSCSHLGDLTPYLTLVASCADLEQGTFDSNRFGLEFMEAFNPLVVLKLLMNNALCYGTMSYAIQGVQSNYMQHEVSGLRAVGEAFLAIAEGRADVVVAGGAAGQVEAFQIHEAYHFGLLADQTVSGFDPGTAVKPYDRNAQGTILSEGVAYLVLEEEEHAKRRGALILGRVTGFATAADGEMDEEAGHKPSAGLVRAARAACAMAGTNGGDLAFVAGNGSGVPLSDYREARAYLEWLREHVGQVPIFSIKGVTGELGEASGVASLIIAAQALDRGLVPPTTNFKALPSALKSLKLAETTQPVARGPAAVVSRSRFGVSAVVTIAPA